MPSWGYVRAGLLRAKYNSGGLIYGQLLRRHWRSHGRISPHLQLAGMLLRERTN